MDKNSAKKIKERLKEINEIITNCTDEDILKNIDWRAETVFRQERNNYPQRFYHFICGLNEVIITKKSNHYYDIITIEEPLEEGRLKNVHKEETYWIEEAEEIFYREVQKITENKLNKRGVLIWVAQNH